MVSLINYTGIGARPFESIQTLAPIVLKIRTTGKKAFALREGIDLEVHREGDWLNVNLPRLEVFETLVLSDIE